MFKCLQDESNLYHFKLQGLQGQKGIFDFQITGWKINIFHNRKVFFKSRQKHNFDHTIQFLCTIVLFSISTSLRKYGILIVSYPLDTKFSNYTFDLFFVPNIIANFWLAKQKIQNDEKCQKSHKNFSFKHFTTFWSLDFMILVPNSYFTSIWKINIKA